jgi:hypothetical protein
MNFLKEKEYRKIAKAAGRIEYEINQASEPTTSHDKIEKAKRATGKILFHYATFLDGITPEEKKNVVRTLGPRIANLEEGLAHLQEAPE